MQTVNFAEKNSKIFSIATNINSLMHTLNENKIQVYRQNTYNNMFRQLKKIRTSKMKYSKRVISASS